MNETNIAGFREKKCKKSQRVSQELIRSLEMLKEKNKHSGVEAPPVSTDVSPVRNV